MTDEQGAHSSVKDQNSAPQTRPRPLNDFIPFPVFPMKRSARSTDQDVVAEA